MAARTRIINVVYNASNNELVRTNTLVRNSIVQIDATPFRQWYLKHYGIELGRKADKKAEEGKTETTEKKASKRQLRNYARRQRQYTIEKALADQFLTGKLLACISSRPGQVGRADGYIIEGKELEFYQRKLEKKKSK